MPNEIRPCTLWGETFDAMEIGTFLYRPVPYHTQTKNKTEYRIELFINDSDSIFSPPARDKKELEQYKFEVITNIAHALNAPVLATKAVLAGLPQGSDFLAHKVGYTPIWQSAFYCTESQKWWSQDEPLDESYIIKSDGCSETLAKLLQFTLEGVRIKEGG